MIQAKAKATLYAKNITTDTPTNTQDNQTQDTQDFFFDDYLHAHE